MIPIKKPINFSEKSVKKDELIKKIMKRLRKRDKKINHMAEKFNKFVKKVKEEKEKGNLLFPSEEEVVLMEVLMFIEKGIEETIDYFNLK